MAEEEAAAADESILDALAAGRDPRRGAVVLARLCFAVFGLGTRQYEHFTPMGKCADARVAAAVRG